MIAVPRPSIASSSALSLRLVAVEEHAPSFEAYVRADDCDETQLLAQLTGEPPAAFAHRVAERIAAAAKSEHQLTSVTVLVSSRCDDAAMLSRRLVAHALAMYERSSRGGSAELVFVVDARAHAELRVQLLSLVESLVRELRSSSLSIRLRFGSGTHTRVRPSEPPPSPRRDAA